MWGVLTVLLLTTARVLRAADNGLALAPIRGWTTWCTETAIPCYNDFCDEQEVKSIIDAMVDNGLRKLGYDYVLLDDCWAATKRDAASDEIRADTTRFPSGTLKPLADYAHARGFKLGAYTDVAEHTCRDGRTGSGGHYALDAMTFAAWGLDMIKADWCGHDRSKSAKQIYTEFWTAINATQRPMLFAACEWGVQKPWTWAANVTNMWRIGPDHLPLWWTPETNQDPGQGQGTANIIQHAAGLSRYAGPGAWNDLDFLMTGEVWQSRVDDRTEFTFWCLLGSPLLFATDPRDVRRKQALFNAEALAVHGDALGVVGDLRYNGTDGAQIWSRPLANKRWAAVIYNSNIWFERVGAGVDLHFNATLLPGWPASATRATVRDLWAHADLGVFDAKFTTADSLDVHESLFLLVAPAA